jgi:transcriptional regulator with XRE-family HTH domain
MLYAMGGATFADWLARELVRREMSQSDFARKIGASTGRVSEWLSGRRRPSPGSLDKITDALPGADLDYLLSIAGYRPIETNTEEHRDPLAELISTFDRRQRDLFAQILGGASKTIHIDDARDDPPEREGRQYRA